MKIIDLNCDMGENKCDDGSVIRYISSANIACGGHAGDFDTIRKSIRLAKAKGVKVGAHPGYADKENFGRLETGQEPKFILETVLGQIRTFVSIAEKENSTISHIKLHGALYSRAATDYNLMLLLVSGVIKEFGNIPFFTLAGSESEKAVQAAGGFYFSEGFADREYDRTGKLISRKIKGSVLHDKEYIAERVLNMVMTGKLKSIDGEESDASIDTICLHGDTPGAVLIAEAINEILTLNNIIIGRRDAL